MRIDEIASPVENLNQLAALSQFLIGRSNDTNASMTISTDAFLKLASDMGISITKQQLIDLIQRPPLDNLIADVQDDKVVFKGSEDLPDTMSVDQARATVDSMAKRAAKKGL